MESLQVEMSKLENEKQTHLTRIHELEVSQLLLLFLTY